MKSESNIFIVPLDIIEHLNIIKNLDLFWGSKSEVVKNSLHPVIPLLYSDISYVIKTEKEIIGFLYSLLHQNSSFLHTISISPKYNRSGYGTRLIRHWEKRLSVYNVNLISAYTTRDNKISQNFFKKNNYSFQNEIEVYPQEFRVLFTKKI